MKFTELKKNLPTVADNIFLIEGDDAFFRNGAVDLIKNTFVSQPELNFSAYDGDFVTSNCGEFISALTAYPFMSEKRMVLVKEFYPKPDFIEKNLSQYFINPVQETLFVIENVKSCDVLKKQPNVCYVDCDKADIDILSRWIVNETSRNGVRMISIDAEKLAEYCLRDMTKIANETKKLIDYAKPKGVITEEDVNLLVTKDTEYQIYEMTDYIGRKRYDQAFTTIKEMLAKGETPQRLIISIYNYFRRLLHVALSDLDNAELAKVLGIKEYAVKKTREQAKNFKKKSLKSAVDFLTDSDFFTKSGKTSFEDALSNALFEILI